MKKALIVAVLAVFSVCALTGCASGADTITPPLTPQCSEVVLSPTAEPPAPVQATIAPDDAFRLTVPYQSYPEHIDNIPVKVHLPANEVVYGALVPKLERLLDGEWTEMRVKMGYCGTPDVIKDGGLLPLPISSYEDIGAGEYRVSLGVSDTLRLDTEKRAYTYFDLTEGVRVTADPRPYAADAGDLTLTVFNPSEGRVTLAYTEVQIERMDGGDWIGCGPAALVGSLALDQGEKHWVSSDLSGLSLPSGTYRAIVILSRSFHGEEISEVRSPEFQIK